MTIRIGVIGTGAIGRDHARRINQVLAGGKIVALSDVNRASAEAVKADIAPDAEIFATGEALIASASVDAVLVTSWGATHEQYVWRRSPRASPASARSRSPPPRRARNASSMPRSPTASAWCRSASCAATTRATSR